MNKFLFFILLCFACASCNNNSTTNIPQSHSVEEDSSRHVAKKPVYISVKREFKREGVWDDTVLKVGRSNVKVSMSRTCKGDYTISDTSCASDTCWVSIYKELVLHIKIKSPQEYDIVFDRSVLGKKFKGLDSSKGLIDITDIDSVNNKTKEILFTTHISMNGGGYDISYSINMKGELKLISKEELFSIKG